MSTHQTELMTLAPNVRHALGQLLTGFTTIATSLTTPTEEEQYCQACVEAALAAMFNDEPVVGSLRNVKVEGETHACCTVAVITTEKRAAKLSLTDALALLSEHHGLHLV